MARKNQEFHQFARTSESGLPSPTFADDEAKSSPDLEAIEGTPQAVRTPAQRWAELSSLPQADPAVEAAVKGFEIESRCRIRVTLSVCLRRRVWRDRRL